MFSGPLNHTPKELFGNWPVLRTADVDQAAALLSTSAVPYRCELLSPASTFVTEISASPGLRTHLSRVKTAGAMRVQATLPSDSYAMILAVSGELQHQLASQTVPVRSGCGFIQSPEQLVNIRTPAQFELLFLRVDRDHMVRELEKMLLRTIHTPLVFSPRFETLTAAGQGFRSLLSRLCVQLSQEVKKQAFGRGGRPGEGVPGSRQTESREGLSAQTLEDDLVTLLLDSQRHNYSRLLVRGQNPGSWQLRAAEEYMAANADQTLSLGDVCLAAGVNSRTLQHSFQTKRGCTPMQFLKRLRLERVHADLTRPGETATVTETASRWGFLHFGRFAGEYLARFGERPSATARRSRAQS
jgi:AraC-like DNA-binding protein